jgi:hypothetical protein
MPRHILAAHQIAIAAEMLAARNWKSSVVRSKSAILTYPHQADGMKGEDVRSSDEHERRPAQRQLRPALLALISSAPNVRSADWARRDTAGAGCRLWDKSS